MKVKREFIGKFEAKVDVIRKRRKSQVDEVLKTSNSGLFNDVKPLQYKSRCLFALLPGPVMLQIMRKMDFKSLMSLRLTCKSLAIASRNPCFADRFHITILCDHKYAVFRNRKVYTYSAFSNRGVYFHPAALKIVVSNYVDDLDLELFGSYEEFGFARVTRCNPSLKLLIFDTSESFLLAKLIQLQMVLSLRPSITTLVLPRVKTNTAKARVRETFPNLEIITSIE